MSCLDYMISNNEEEMLELLIHPKLNIPLHSTYINERSIFYRDRIHSPGYLLSFIDSGMVSNLAYGARVRKV